MVKTMKTMMITMIQMMMVMMTMENHQCSEDEEDHEEASNCRLTLDVTVSNCWHGNQGEVNTLPVRQVLTVGEVGEWITWVFHLDWREQQVHFKGILFYIYSLNSVAV